MNNLITSFQYSPYLAIFLAMVIEGPMATIGAAFLASLGVFNLLIIFWLSVLGDLVGDFLQFFAGKTLDFTLIRKYGERLGIKEKTAKGLERHMKNHLGKTLFFAKLIPPLATPALMLAGIGKVSFKRLALFSFLTTLPRTLILIFAGYYFGRAFNKISQIFEFGKYAIIFGILFFIIAVLIYNLILKFIRKRVNKFSL